MHTNFYKTILFMGLILLSFTICAQTDNIYGNARLLNQKDTGYRGIWYNIGSSGQGGTVTNEYRYKYSGGLGTYPANHYPFSVYAKKVNKTFFCYGGTNDSGNTLYHMVSYFNHKTGEVPRPTIVLDKATDDAHDNPVMQIDKDGYIWIFSTSHGTGRPSFIHRSTLPYDITKFERVAATKMVDRQKVPLNNFSYLQMYYNDEEGFTGLFTHYEKVGGRVIGWMTSKDGIDWSEWKDLSILGQGQYQTSGNQGKIIGTSFNYHPDRKVRGGLDFRTNLYYLQTKDFGKTWQTVDGSPIDLPLTQISNKALVHDYDSEKRNVYISDVNFDKKGFPVILYITSKGPILGPEDGPRNWNTAHWNGKQWEINPFTTSDNNYDMGSIYVEKNGNWKVIGSTGIGPQTYNTGGEIVMWVSKDKGKNWEKVKQMTENSEFNHTYPRRAVNVNPGFYAFWADGHGRQPSKSRFYFSDKDGNVFILPEKMTSDFAKPALYKSGNNQTIDKKLFRKKHIKSEITKVTNWQLNNPKHNSRDWTNGAFYAGVFAAWKTTRSKEIYQSMMEMGNNNQWKPGPSYYHADDAAICQTYIDLYREEKHQEMIQPTIDAMTSFMEKPYPTNSPIDVIKWWWCDALFMAPPTMVKLGITTGNTDFLDYNDKCYKECYNLLYNKEEHLFARDLNYVINPDGSGPKEVNGKRIFWSRGNGWVMGGLVRILQELPVDYPERPFYEKLFKEMSARIMSLQQSDGLWRTSLLDPASYPGGEVSGSGFYCYAMAWGINNKLLDKKIYLPTVEKAWVSLTACVNEDGRVGWVQPIGADPRRNFNADSWEVYGTGAYLLAASEVIKLKR